MLSLGLDVRQWVTPDQPEIRSLAFELGSPSAIYDYMRNIKYVSGFYLLKPIEVLHRGQGDCDEQAVLLCSLLRAIGEEAFVRVAKIEDWPILHAWVVWRDPAYGCWRNLDPSGTVWFLDDPGYGETLPITMLLDFNDQKIYDYGGLNQILHIFRA
ncbi:MAG: transglutaminase family protein [Candidatus Bathyarchaeia archaeon]